jgi:ubiquinone/menaquinone biosynthesis C-methylase UbiE
MMANRLQDTVQTAFSAAAGHYATSAVHAQGEDLRRIVQIAALSGRERVLDAGCGAGHTTLALASHAREVVAYDLTPKMLAEVERLAAARGLTSVIIAAGDVEALPFADGEFDWVVSRYSAHHWPNVPHALREFRRVLKPGGCVLVSDIMAPHAPLLDSWLQTLEIIRDPSHVRDHTREQWCDMLYDARFDPQVMAAWMLPLDFAAWVERMATPQAFVALLADLMAGAPQEVRAAYAMTFHMGAHGQRMPDSFSIPGALVLGRRMKGRDG